MDHFYSELFPDNFRDFENSILFLPIGTLEWHGAHLPFGTDFIVAEGIIQRALRSVKGFSLPPLYISTDLSKNHKGVKLNGMDLQLNKKLIGSIYYLEPDIFYKVLKNLTEQIKAQGFNKLVMVTGHTPKKQLEVLERIKNNTLGSNFNIILINPYQIIGQKYKTIRHGGFIETSLLWALRPDLIQQSSAKNLENDEIIKLRGQDPRIKASKELGNDVLKYLIENLLNLLKAKL